MIYLDSAAAVKLVHGEEHSRALRAWLDQHAEYEWVSSAFLEIEVFRALARNTPRALEHLPTLLDNVRLIEIDVPIRARAQAIEPHTVRSLDAIHLATALAVRDSLIAFISYDKRLGDAARMAALPTVLPVDTPAAEDTL